jgi:hypothetical protein
MQYGYCEDLREPDGVLIEDDAGWGMLVGPEFGCVHHQAGGRRTFGGKTQ